MAKTRVSKAPEERRAELITAARRLFDEVGVEKTRVSDIVNSVGVAQGVFYYYFQSKDEIVKAVVDEISRELESDISAILNDISADFYQKLANLLELYIGLIDQFTEDNALALPDFSGFGMSSGAPTKRTRQILMEQIEKLVLAAQGKDAPYLRYPDWTVHTVEAGLLSVAGRRLPSREVVFSLVEDALRLPEGSLMQYIKGGVQKPDEMTSDAT